MIDLYIVYKILRKLTSPFTKWKAFDDGIIDGEGNILKKAGNRKSESFTKLDLLILRFKKLIAKMPLMNRKFASLAAAMWMIRENYDIDPDMITEENLLESMSLLKEEEGAGTPPTNNTMNVAGADGTEVVVTRKAQKEIVRRVRKKKRKKE